MGGQPTFSPKSKLSSLPRLIIPWKQYTVSGTPKSVSYSALIAAGSVKSDFSVMTFLGSAALGAFGWTMSQRIRWRLGVLESDRSSPASWG